MSRVRRPVAGLDITCRDHRDEVLFRPRKAPGTGKMSNAGGPPTVPLAYRDDDRAPSDFVYSRGCPRRNAAGTDCCPIHPEFHRDKVEAVLIALVQYGAPWHRVWTVTDREMELLIKYPAKAPNYLAQRAAGLPG